MPPFPLNLADYFGHWPAYLVFVVIGIAFGAVLEMSGFGNSKKLAAQFYFKDMTVLKVMFGAIIVAMSLIFLMTGLGLLDYNLIWVNPTYLWPGVVGGLLMGVGFIIGGFCPGTSLVAAATAKIDGILFALGVFFGIFLFGETETLFDDFFYSSYMGRYTLPELFGVSTGVVVLGIVVMALLMFWGSEHLERIFGGKDPKSEPRWRYAAAGGLTLLAGAVLLIGQPSAQERWERIADEKEALLEARAVQIHPAELLDNIHDPKIQVIMIDVRDVSDYNLFHILDSTYIPLEELSEHVEEFLQEPPNTLFVTISNDETRATEAWKYLVAESVPNVYILEGGINNWLDLYASEEFKADHPIRPDAGDDELKYTFTAAFGAHYDAAYPNPEAFEYEYEPKVKLEVRRGPSSGGCG